MELIGQSDRHYQIAGPVTVRTTPYLELSLHLEAVLPRSRQGIAAISLFHPQQQPGLRGLLGELPYRRNAVKNYTELVGYTPDEAGLAFILAHDSRNPVHSCDFHLAKIRSNHLLGRKWFGTDIKGLGRFLMRNLLSLVDLQEASIGLVASADRDYLRDHPEDEVRGLQLPQKDLRSWYQELGFRPMNLPSGCAEYYTRTPQQPDLTTEVIKALSLAETKLGTGES